MAEKNERLGLLLIFDCIAAILATFGVLLIFQMLITQEVNTNTMILSCFFVGIKLLLMGICDITGIGRHLMVALLFIIISDCVAFAINFLMVFGLSSKLLLITMVADAVMIIISHLIWSKAFSGKHNEKRERKAWLNERDIEREDDEYEDIFESVSSREQTEAQTEAASEIHEDRESFDGLFEEEDKELQEFEYDDEEAFDEYDEDDLDDEEAGDLFETMPESLDEKEKFDDDDSYLDEEAFKSLLISDDDLLKVEDAIGDQAKDENELLEASEEEATAEMEEAESEEDPKATEEALEEVDQTEAVKDADVAEELLLGAAIQAAGEGVEPEKVQELEKIEERLGVLLEELNESTAETGKLEKSVEDFKHDLDQLTPITKDSDIIETGDIIREKLKNIIDKQFIVDEVLDDLIRLSGQINKRIDDLDAIEADLNKRSEMLDKKEFLFMSRKNAALSDVQVSSQEVVLENEDAEIIIDQQDLEKIMNAFKDQMD